MASGWLSLGRVSKTGMTQSSSEEPLSHLSPPHAVDQGGWGDPVPMGMRTSSLVDVEKGLCQDLGLSPPACLWGKKKKPLQPTLGKGGFFFVCLPPPTPPPPQLLLPIIVFIAWGVKRYSFLELTEHDW